MRYRTIRCTQRQQGFTIVELLVATLIFAVVLLLVTIGILQVSRVYYQGVTEANTQNAARSIVDTIAQAIQFNGGTVTATTNTAPGAQGYFCAGGQQFIYYPGVQLTNGVVGAHQASKVLIQKSITGGCTAPMSVTGRELLSPHMRLSDLQVTNVGNNLWQITVRVVYGDKDLLHSRSAPANINGDEATDAMCNGQLAGTQFCAASELVTTVVERVP